MKEEIKLQLKDLLDRHIQVLNKKIAENEDLQFVLEVLESLSGKIKSDELETLLQVEEREFKDLEHLFKDEKEKNLIHKISGIRYLVAGIHDKHVHIEITKEQKQMIEEFLKLVQEKKNMIIPILKRDSQIIEQDKTKQLSEKLQKLNTHTYLSELEELKNVFSEFDVPSDQQYKLLYSILEHNYSVYTSLKKTLEKSAS